MSELYINKNPNAPNGGEWVATNEVHSVDAEGNPRMIAYIYKGAKLVWGLIVGFIFTRDGYSIQSKDGYIIKCKDQ